mmetsp:Transcript_6590/g.15020  ORF Transcript_6590/g.15020 Transcript_6590/m.15020 type:complete len:86 (+) Transcript_6590:643-900(+)
MPAEALRCLPESTLEKSNRATKASLAATTFNAFLLYDLASDWIKPHSASNPVCCLIEPLDKPALDSELTFVCPRTWRLQLGIYRT